MKEDEGKKNEGRMKEDERMKIYIKQNFRKFYVRQALLLRLEKTITKAPLCVRTLGQPCSIAHSSSLFLPNEELLLRLLRPQWLNKCANFLLSCKPGKWLQIFYFFHFTFNGGISSAFGFHNEKSVRLCIRELFNWRFSPVRPKPVFICQASRS